MNRWRWLTGVVAIAVVTGMTGVASADRVPMTRSEGQRSSGSRTDITVPYLTTGTTAFGAYWVAPRIYASPIVDDPVHPQTRPVYNLPFYGGRQAFGDRSEGATPRTK
jgi:hypothetical protein